MSRLAPLLAVLLCCAVADARAEAPASPRPGTPPAKGRHAGPGAARRSEAKGSGRAAGHPPAEPIVGPAGRDRPGETAAPARDRAGGSAWSLSPGWNASSGSSSAAYGTRALIDELHANPAEATGYGAGAKLDFHF